MKSLVTRSQPRSLDRLLAPLLWLAVIMLALAHGFALLSKFNPFFELFTHFAAQYLAVGIVLAGLALIARRYVAFAVALGLGLSNLAPLWPYLVAAPPAIASDGPTLRLVSVNLANMRADAGKLDAFLQSTDADIVVLTELAGQLDSALARAQTRFPHSLRTSGTRHHPFGLLVLSHHELKDAVIHQPFGVDFPIVEFRHCRPPAPCAAIVALHAVRPNDLDNLRDRMLGFAFERARLAAMAREPVILAGDLNLTPFSPVFGRFAGLGLRDAALGQGWQPTWPTSLGPLGIPIDHVLLSRGIELRRFERLPAMGSDHRPISVELRLPAKPMR